MGSSSCHINLIDPLCTVEGSTKYHKAARDGNVIVLLEGTKRDFNRRDEDGLTPVHWAAYDGKLEALRVITGRGGNPDLHDLYGNTPLHYAARNNHLNCVSYLINFGCNIWAVDNDGHSALETAALFDHKAVVKYLDADMACRYAADTKKAEKLKKKSLEDAKKRLKELTVYNSSASSGSCSSTVSSGSLNTSATVGGRGSRYHGDLRHKMAATMSKKFCDVFKRLQTAANSNNDSNPNTDAKCGNDGTINSASSVMESFKQRKWCSSTDVVYNNPVERRDSIGSLFETNSKLYDRRMGLFERPGLGTVSFRHLDLLSMFPSESFEDQASSFNTNSSSESCISNASSCNESNKASELSTYQPTTLEEFFKSYGLMEYLDIFQREKITLDSLLLLNEEDFIELKLPMGPRKLLAKAVIQLKSSKPT